MPRPKWPCASPCARRRSASFGSLHWCHPSCHVYGPLSVHFVCQEPPGQQQLQSGIAPSSRFMPHFWHVCAAAAATSSGRRRIWLWGSHRCGCFCRGCATRWLSVLRIVCRTICGALPAFCSASSAEHTSASVFMCASLTDFYAERNLSSRTRLWNTGVLRSFIGPTASVHRRGLRIDCA